MQTINDKWKYKLQQLFEMLSLSLDTGLELTLGVPRQFDPSSSPSCSPLSYSDPAGPHITFLVAFSIVVLKPSFSQSLPLHRGLSFPQGDMTTGCLAVTGCVLLVSATD